MNENLRKLGLDFKKKDVPQAANDDLEDQNLLKAKLAELRQLVQRGDALLSRQSEIVGVLSPEETALAKSHFHELLVATHDGSATRATVMQRVRGRDAFRMIRDASEHIADTIELIEREYLHGPQSREE